MKRAAYLFGAGMTAFFVMFSAGPAVLHTGAAARAAETPPAEAGATPAQRAKQHYLQGEAYFKAKNFSEAMDEYQKGYLEKPDPVFIFNIAQCQRLLGNGAAAVEFYQRYLKEAPDGAGRPVAEREIAELRRASEPRGAAQPAAVAPPETSVPQAPPGPIVPLPAAAQPAPAVAEAPPPAAPAPAPATDEVAPATAPALPAAPAPDASRSSPVFVTAEAQQAEKPVYTRWYFWTAIGVLVVSTVIVAAATSSSRPNCDLGRTCK